MKRSTNAKHVGAALVGFGFVALGVAPGCGSSSNGGTPGGGAPDAAGDHTTGGSEAGADAPVATDAPASSDGAVIDTGAVMEASAPTCFATAPGTPTVIGSTYTASDAGATKITFGTSPDQWGTYTYESDGQAAPTLSISAAGLQVVESLVVPDATGSAYAGAGVAFDSSACLDASGYAGVQFTITGSLGGCQLAFDINIAEDTLPSNDANRGLCEQTTCYGPSYAITAPGTFTVPFTSLMGGMPVGTVDATALTSIQWQLALPATTPEGGAGGCSANYTVSDVSFVGGDGGTGGGGTDSGATDAAVEEDGGKDGAVHDAAGGG